MYKWNSATCKKQWDTSAAEKLHHCVINTAGWQHVRRANSVIDQFAVVFLSIDARNWMTWSIYRIHPIHTNADSWRPSRKLNLKSNAQKKRYGFGSRRMGFMCHIHLNVIKVHRPGIGWAFRSICNEYPNIPWITVGVPETSRTMRSLKGRCSGLSFITTLVDLIS